MKEKKKVHNVQVTRKNLFNALKLLINTAQDTNISMSGKLVYDLAVSFFF